MQDETGRCAVGTGPDVAVTPSADYRNGVQEIDRRIMALLCRNGRISYTELSRQTGLSVSGVHQRVRQLERQGLIKGYAAVVELARVGLPLTAFVSIKPVDPSALGDPPELLAHLLGIEACYSVAGDENYILKVRAATSADLEALLKQIRISANVSTRTTVVLSTPYENRPPDFGIDTHNSHHPDPALASIHVRREALTIRGR